MDKKDNIYLTIVFLLMLISGLIIYFMYLKPKEGFFTTTVGETTTTAGETTTTAGETTTTVGETTTTAGTTTTTTGTTTTTAGATTTTNPLCKQPDIPAAFKSIMSRYFGIGFNIEYFEQQDAYLINHIPTISNGTLGGCYAITSDNLLTIRLKNRFDNTQLWKMTEKTDTISKYYIVQPKDNTNFSLQYENGNLALRPYNSTSSFESQKWLLTNTEITRSIPVLNYSPGSLFTSEFDPYSTPAQYSSSLTEQNTQQVNDVLNSVKAGLQQYLGQLDNKNQTTQVSSSSLGQKDTPLNINLNLSPKNNQVSSFADIGELSTDMTDIMNRYGTTSTNQVSNSTQLYKKSDLENEINKSQGCKLFNINDYTSSRVASCNCKL